MGLETGSFINDLNSANPVGATDQKKYGDDHLRLIKSVLKATLPGMAGRAWRIQAKSAAYAPVVTDNISMLKATAAVTFTFDAAATLGNGFLCLVWASNGDVVLDGNGSELVAGAATYTVPSGQTVLVLCDGSALHVFSFLKASSITSTVIDVDMVFTGDVTFDGTSTFNSDVFFNGAIHGLWKNKVIDASDCTSGVYSVTQSDDHYVLSIRDGCTSVVLPDVASTLNGAMVYIRNRVGLNGDTGTPGTIPISLATATDDLDGVVNGTFDLPSAGHVGMWCSDNSDPLDNHVWAKFFFGGTFFLNASVQDEWAMAVGDTAGVLVAGTRKAAFRARFDYILDIVAASLLDATTTGTVTVDVNIGGVSVLTNKITIDATKLTSDTAVVPPTLTGTITGLRGDEIVIDVDDDGDGTASGLIVYFSVRRT